jgi:hypothetical protein
MIALADHAQFVHLETGTGQLLYGCLRGLVAGKDGNDCISWFHAILVQNEGVMPRNKLLRGKP